MSKSALDDHIEFMKLPPLYKSPEDISKFIKEHGCSFPVLENLLKMRAENKLKEALTPTEIKFFFDEVFDYIYDVYKRPNEETYKGVKDYLSYIENNLTFGGVGGVKIQLIQQVLTSYRSMADMVARFNDFFGPKGKRRKRIKKINYYKNIGNVRYPEFYESKDKDLIESFWIKSDLHTGQPAHVDGEAYMRVHVFPNRVYIFGCDDCSYTLQTKTKKEAKEFAKFLKCAMPFWDFGDLYSIHPKLEFTN